MYHQVLNYRNCPRGKADAGMHGPRHVLGECAAHHKPAQRRNGRRDNRVENGKSVGISRLLVENGGERVGSSRGREGGGGFWRAASQSHICTIHLFDELVGTSAYEPFVETGNHHSLASLRPTSMKGLQLVDHILIRSD